MGVTNWIGWFAVVVSSIPRFYTSGFSNIRSRYHDSTRQRRFTTFAVDVLLSSSVEETRLRGNENKEDTRVETEYDLDDAFVQAQWLMPSVVERALVYQDESVDPYELLRRLDMSDSDRSKAVRALECSDESQSLVQTARGALTGLECTKLRNFLHKRIQDDGIDNVDGCPDWQVNITPHKLRKIIGPKAVERLLNVPEQLFSTVSASENESFEYDRVGIFIRMYQRSKRPWMPFHRDGNQWTLNVALNDDSEFQGGRLLALYNGRVQVMQNRLAGDGTCHAGEIQHGVSAMQSGTRYSMILFFHSADTV